MISVIIQRSCKTLLYTIVHALLAIDKDPKELVIKPTQTVKWKNKCSSSSLERNITIGNDKLSVHKEIKILGLIIAREIQCISLLMD